MNTLCEQCACTSGVESSKVYFQKELVVYTISKSSKLRYLINKKKIAIVIQMKSGALSCNNS